MRICCVGDSLTNGAHDGLSTPTPKGGYRGHEVDGLNATGWPTTLVGSVVTDGYGGHEGRNGWSINQHRATLPGVIATYRPNVLQVLLGTNDMLQVEQPDALRADAPARLGVLLAAIFAAAPNIDVLVGTIPTVTAPQHCPPQQDGPAQIATYNAALPAVVAARRAVGQRVQLVDIGAAIGTELSDGVHGSDRGYQNACIAWYGAITALPFAPLPALPAAAVDPVSPAAQAGVSLSVTVGTVTYGLSGASLERVP